MKKSQVNRNADDYVVNPLTGMLVKIGSKKYMQLMKDNYLQLDPNTRKDNVVFDGPDPDNKIKSKLKKNPKMNLKNCGDKIVEQRRKMNTVEHINNMTIKSANVIKKYMNEFSDEMTDDEVYAKVKKLLSQEIIGEPKKNVQFIVKEPIYNLESGDEADDNSDSDE
jgi:hypothetical protein